MAETKVSIPEVPISVKNHPKAAAAWQKAYINAFKQATIDNPQDELAAIGQATREANRMLRVDAPDQKKDNHAELQDWHESLEPWQIHTEATKGDGVTTVVTIDGKKRKYRAKQTEPAAQVGANATGANGAI